MTKKEEKKGKEKKENKKCEKEEGKVQDKKKLKKKKVKSTSDAMQVRCGWRAPTRVSGRRGYLYCRETTGSLIGSTVLGDEQVKCTTD